MSAEEHEPQEPSPEKLHPILRGTLEQLEEQGALAPDETIVDRELAGMKRTPGVLLVTDRRVVFVRAATLRERAMLVSLPLADVTGVEATERRSPIRKRGVLRLRSAGDETVVEHIPGGQRRAEELARAIGVRG